MAENCFRLHFVTPGNIRDKIGEIRSSMRLAVSAHLHCRPVTLVSDVSAIG